MWTVDRVMRALATACQRENRRVPGAHAVVLGPHTVRFRLTTPDERPPAGWSADQEGRIWQAPLRGLQSARIDESLPEPYPRLVSLGTSSEGFILLNLGQAGGAISVEGDGRQARAMAEEWSRELTTSPWSRGVRVVRLGFNADPADPVAAVDAAKLADVEPALVEDSDGVLLLAGLPGGRDGDRVRRLADDPAGRWSVVVVGRVDDPRWRLTVDATGVVDTGLFDEPVARRPDASVDAAVPEAAAAAPAERSVGASSRQRRPLFARPRVVVPVVALAGLLIVAVVLAVPAITRQNDASRQTRSAATGPNAGHSPKTASKDVPPGGTGVIRSVTTGLCVGSDTRPAVILNGAPAGGHAFSLACNRGRSQQWREGPLLANDTPRSSDMYRLVDQQTGFCLDSNDTGGIYTLPCMDGDVFQLWQRLSLTRSAANNPGPNATLVAYRDQETNRCLEVSVADHQLQTKPCPTNDNWPDDMLFHRLP